MNLEELTRRFRVMSRDTVEPYLFADEDVADWLSDAQAQACVRGRLLLEDANPAVCQVAIEAGRHSYRLHATLYELVDVRFKSAGADRAAPIKIVSREWLDDNVRDWRNASAMDCAARYLVQGETRVRIVPTPAEAGVLLIEGYRLPLKPLANDYDKPEIHEASHEQLIQWALHRAFSIPDAETFDANRAALAEHQFSAYFGPLPDADMRRITRHDEPHANKVFLP